MTKRCFCSAAICFIFGLLFSMKNLTWVLLPALGLVFVAFFYRYANELRVLAVFVSCALFISFFAGVFYGRSEVNFCRAYLQRLYDGKQISVSGRLYKIETKSSGVYLYLDKARILIDEQNLSCKDVLVVTDTDDYVLGKYLVLDGRYQSFSKARNQGNYDEEEYYYGRGVDIKIVQPQNVRAFGSEKTLRQELYLLRKKMMIVMEMSLDEQDAGVLGAMVTGDRTGMDPETKQLYSSVGISHLLSVSGLHVSLLCFGIYVFLRKLRMSLLSAALISAVFSVSYCIFTGESVATVRAVGMFLIMLFATVIGESYDSLSALGFMCFIILLKNPMLLTTASFVMSFGAVLGVVVTGRKLTLIYENLIAAKKRKREYFRNIRRKEDPKRWRLVTDKVAVSMEAVPSAILMNLGIMLTTIPMTAWFYYEVPVFSMLINLLIIPLMGLLLGLGFSGSLLGCVFFPAGYEILQPCGYILRFYEFTARCVGMLPWSTWVVGRPSLWGIIVYYILLFISLSVVEKICNTTEADNFVNGKHRPAEKLCKPEFAICLYITSLILVSFSLMLLLHFSVAKLARICMVDVDQGDGIYIRTSEGRNVFIDGGSTGVSSVGKYRILPYLKYSGVGSIDYWFVTHSDEDHVSGLAELLESGYNVKKLIFSEYVVMNKNTESLISLAQSSGTEVLFMRAGDILSDGTDSFTCIMPNQPALGGVSDPNEQSLVLYYDASHISALFTGDMGQPSEAELLKRWAWPDDGKTRILKVAHHGSKNSSSAEFLKMVGKKEVIALISVGGRNSYGHPHVDTLEKLEAEKADVYRTDKMGQITIETNKRNPVIKKYIKID